MKVVTATLERVLELMGHLEVMAARRVKVRQQLGNQQSLKRINPLQKCVRNHLLLGLDMMTLQVVPDISDLQFSKSKDL